MTQQHISGFDADTGRQAQQRPRAWCSEESTLTRAPISRGHRQPRPAVGRPAGTSDSDTPAGYRAALAFLAQWTGMAAVGVECTGSYGAALTRHLRGAGLRVIEVNRPNRFDRHARGKTDVFDACSAAEAVMTGRAAAAPKGSDGLVEAVSDAGADRSSAMRERTATINQIKAMLISGPDRLRSQYASLSNIKLTAALAASRPAKTPVTAHEATAYALRVLARRYRGSTSPRRTPNVCIRTAGAGARKTQETVTTWGSMTKPDPRLARAPDRTASDVCGDGGQRELLETLTTSAGPQDRLGRRLARVAPFARSGLTGADASAPRT